MVMCNGYIISNKLMEGKKRKEKSERTVYVIEGKKTSKIVRTEGTNPKSKEKEK